MAAHRHRVLIVGAGFGGLAAARALADEAVDVTLIDARNHHTFQPLLYQVATAGLDDDDVCHPTRAIFRRQHNVRVRLGRVVDVDLEGHVVALAGGETLPFDSLVLACGAVTDSFGVRGVDEHAHGLKSASDALRVRTRLLRNFELADGGDLGPSRGGLTTVIVGGGPTGVELAGGTAELIHGVLRHDFRGVDIDSARIVLVEAGPRLLPSFPERLSEAARRRLAAMGVEVLLSSTVDAVGPTSVTLGDGSEIPCGLAIWAAGVKAHPLGEALGVPTQRGRIAVDDQLTIPRHPGVFVIGDMAASPTADGRPLPQVAPVAIQGGRHVAQVISARLAAEPAPTFSYRDKGSMATIGRHSAVVQLPRGPGFGGPVGWLAWLALHLVMLIGFRNRASVLLNWTWNYLTYDRANRLIVDPHSVDRSGISSD